MLVVLVAALLFQCTAGFIFSSPGQFTWKNCGTENDWVHVSEFNIEPQPVVLPGNLYITLDGSISHQLGHQVTMDIIVEKELLGTWVKVPCSGDGKVGTCHYTDPCHYLNACIFKRGYCPVQLAQNGIPCTCPFNPMIFHLPRSVFHIAQVISGFRGFLRDNHEYRVTIKLNDKQDGNLERMCLQGITRIHVK